MNPDWVDVDPEAEAVYVWMGERLPPDTPVTTREVAHGVMLDYGADGTLVGVEVLR